MSIEIQPDKFHNLRRHLREKPRTGIVLFDSKEIYEQKRGSRLKRADFIKNSKEAKEFFEWIFTIQAILNLSNIQFVRRINKLGGMASLQTLRLWRNARGHYPCDRNYKALLKLEREASFITTKIKNVIRETTTELILK